MERTFGVLVVPGGWRWPDGGGEEESEVRLVTEVFQWLSKRKMEEERVVGFVGVNVCRRWRPATRKKNRRGRKGGATVQWSLVVCGGKEGDGEGEWRDGCVAESERESRWLTGCWVFRRGERREEGLVVRGGGSCVGEDEGEGRRGCCAAGFDLLIY
ncbi:hypothetical protein HAX54_018794 [Datura stramonium]|uniref:Uncharacterized protein n=1 Tax=Datura stramonium TaxID=4076 RepID=A0ABS8UMZ6_DATST|nr:hypothetical protein [Datura stramonium]